MEIFNINENLTITSSLASLYEKYWRAMSHINNDDDLSEVWDYLNVLVMREGLIAVVKGIGVGLTIASVLQSWKDKNNDVICARVSVPNFNGTNDNYIVVNSKYFDKKDLIKEKLTVDTEKSYECVFFKNNPLMESSYRELWPVLSKICAMELVGDRNRELMNVIYEVIGGKKYTKEQLSNFGLTISSDGKGVMLTNLSLDKNQKEPNVASRFTNVPTKTDEWIKEWELWVNLFSKIGGIKEERLVADRENVMQTQSQDYRVNMLENDYFCERQRFINRYNKLFNKNAQLGYGSCLIKERYETNTENLESEKIENE